MNGKIFRNDLIELLKGGLAHLSAEAILHAIEPQNRHIRVQKNLHTIFEELEHMRIAQEDILQYMFDENWTSPKWPEGYWPKNNITVTEKIWKNSILHFFKDLNQVINFVKKSKVDLTSEIPHGEGRTYLREILLVADHNAYHLAKIMQIRKLLQDRPA